MTALLVVALIVIAVVGIVVLVIAYTRKKGRQEVERRRVALLTKYHDPEIVDRIMRRMFWQGQSQEQLLESLGQPADIDQQVMKTKVKEIWKYNHMGADRFGLRITIENNIVIGWDQKD